GIDVYGGYGMSQTRPGVARASRIPAELTPGPAPAGGHRGKARRAAPPVGLRTAATQMRDGPPDGVGPGGGGGRAPWLTRGYHKDERASEALWAGGWLHTQDIGTIDANGYLLITDRIKDVIKTGGEWVSSLQIEDLLTHHPSIAEAAVIGIPDP